MAYKYGVLLWIKYGRCVWAYVRVRVGVWRRGAGGGTDWLATSSTPSLPPLSPK